MLPSQHVVSDAAEWENSPASSIPFSELRKQHFKECNYQGEYVTMRDGTKIAVDVLLPKNAEPGSVTACMTQCRYMRGLSVRWPFSILTKGVPLDLLHADITMRIVQAGYAVVLYDVRGTGASFGRWRSLWSPEEQEDSNEMLDWIVKQPWSSGKAVLFGASYEAGAATFTLAKQHPAVQCAVLMYPFWDLYTDVSCPGGVPLKRFVENWDRTCAALDSNDLSGLGRILKIPFQGTQPVIGAAYPSTSVLTASYWSGLWKYWSARQKGFADISRAVKSRKNFSALKAMQTTRFVDQIDDQSGLAVWEASQCSKVAEIAASKVPMMLVSGWMDSTANAALSIFQHTAGPGSRLIVGPWTHAGYLNATVGHQKNNQPTRFGISNRIVNFINQTMKGEPVNLDEDPESRKKSTGGVGPVSFYTMGYQCGWEHCKAWPPAHLGSYPLYLSGAQGSILEELEDGSCCLEQVIKEGQCPQGQSRYECMTDMRQPMEYTGLGECGHVMLTSRPLKESFQVTGAVEVKLWVGSNDADVDVFCYLESFDPDSGQIEYITEGCFRASHTKTSVPDPSDPRQKAHPDGYPQHSYKAADCRQLQPGSYAECHFTLLPTSFSFSPGHCIRLAISGSDTKHFFSDLPCDGSRTLLVQTGSKHPSAILFPSPSRPIFARELLNKELNPSDL